MNHINKNNQLNSFILSLKHKRPGPVLVSLIVLAGLIIGSLLWYSHNLSPIAKKNESVQIDIIAGYTPHQIADLLEEKSIIRSATAFRIYIRLTSQQNSLKAGRYDVALDKSVPEIVNKLTDGLASHMSITFFPGATLVDNSNKPEKQKQDVTTVLRRAGFSDEEIERGLSHQYSGPLFAGRPEGQSLEGYVFGETYNFHYGVTVETVLQTTFNEFYKRLEKDDLINKFAARGLSLYQAITLASIIEKEAGQVGDHAQIAQVFYKRLNSGMNLGSDVTYQYIADELGVARDTNLDSPYNTRRYGGLPPGPIASPGIASLRAVADPAEGDYLYFLSGDDDITYFSRTEAEHNTKIVRYCQVKCSTL